MKLNLLEPKMLELHFVDCHVLIAGNRRTDVVPVIIKAHGIRIWYRAGVATFRPLGPSLSRRGGLGMTGGRT